jgi:hypothetical protein
MTAPRKPPTAGRCSSILVLASWLAGLPSTAAVGASDLELGVPVACGSNDPCSIQNYVDLDNGPGVRDHGCGVLTYDGHRGTDFQVPDLARMRAGVAVLAAAPGTVRAVRDQMPDTGKKGYEAAGETDRALGNAVVVEHGGGWTTFYGHLRQGSAKVRPGDRVAKAQAVGEVGLSGNTEFPHLHFEVRNRGAVIDPFTGAGPGAPCGDTSGSLWEASARTRLPYKPTGVICAGWSAAAPDRAAVLEDCTRPPGLSVASPTIVAWIELYGVRKGDALRLTLSGPDGVTLAETTDVMEKDRARQFRYAGKKRPGSGWAGGTYRARYTVIRVVAGEQRTVVDLENETEVP